MPVALALHGGCGTPAASELPAADWAQMREHMAAALRSGWTAMQRGGSAVDAVEAAVVALEDSPHFNAGHGAALCEDGTHELDASIMDGSTLAAGAVSAVRHLRNPVRAARAVMERSGCVLLTGAAADEFGRVQGLDCVVNSYFTTARRVAALAKLQALAQRGTLQSRAGNALQTSGAAITTVVPGVALTPDTPNTPITEADRHGTVGAVALDANGHLAAATSTGGFNNKPMGRVGDSPLIGAGTYARDGVCAVSCTGQGEIFIRHAVAYDLTAQMRYAGRTLDHACRSMLDETLAPYRIGAGWVAIDAQGHIAAPFNTLGMARGWVDAGGRVWVGTHAEMIDMGAA
jgi:L-asparaginase / beta-aspartyl-peptidase